MQGCEGGKRGCVGGAEGEVNHPGALSLLLHALIEAIQTDLQSLFLCHQLQTTSVVQSHTKTLQPDGKLPTKTDHTVR